MNIASLLEAEDLTGLAGRYTVGFIRYEDYETFRDFTEANPANPMRYTRNNRHLLTGKVNNYFCFDFNKLHPWTASN